MTSRSPSGSMRPSERGRTLAALGAVFGRGARGSGGVVASTLGALAPGSARNVAIASSSLRRCPTAVTPISVPCDEFRPQLPDPQRKGADQVGLGSLGDMRSPQSIDTPTLRMSASCGTNADDLV